MVLEGADKVIPQVNAIQLETSLIELYQNEITIEKIIPYIKNLGFELYDLQPGYRDIVTNRLYQVDCVFIKTKLRS